MGGGKLLPFWCFFAIICASMCLASDRERYYFYRGHPLQVSPAVMVPHRVSSSSVVLPVYSNVYPKGAYYVAVLVGQPPRPFFLDLDTGSNLTWLQFDAPCVRCTDAPHPPYRPGNELVPCKDPHCGALQSEDYRCENPEQCDYEGILHNSAGSKPTGSRKHKPHS